MEPLHQLVHDYQKHIRGIAESNGLDFFEVIFEMVDADEMNAVAAYSGFPNRYPHWRFGMEYERLSKTYTYGLSKIYEMVVNNDPCYAYLLKANSLVEQKLVMAHVYGHSDFFKTNIHFGHTDRKMMDKAGNNRSKIQRLVARFGQDVVEDFIDACLSLETLIDIGSPMRNPRNSSSYKSQLDESSTEELSERRADVVANRPEKDALLFLLENAPLDDWQLDILSILRDEAYYFAPQRQTKIMNEGWASYWHSTIMTSGLADDSEIFDYADRHAGSMATSGGSLNPYKVGIELFRDIEERWNKGRFGREYEECDDLSAKDHWDQETGLGREKIFEVRRMHNDVTFIDSFLTPEFCERMELFTYMYDDKSSQYHVRSRDHQEVKNKLLETLTNGGHPVIGVMQADSVKSGELTLYHAHEGVDLRIDYAKETLNSLYTLWKRPVHIETVIEDIPKRMSYDGTEHREVKIV